MISTIIKLRNEFLRIKNMGLVKSLREGTTGMGYTFETLINKKEDQNYLPDYNGVEIKTKMGYSKSSIVLFSLVPRMNGDSCVKYLVRKYGYSNKKDRNFKILRCDVFANSKVLIFNKYYFKLVIDYTDNQLKLLSYDNDFNILDNKIYWSLDELKNRLLTKLKYLAIIKGYPYKRDDGIYYRYTNFDAYELRGFDNFLELIDDGLIFITFNIEENIEKAGILKCQNVQFRINIQDVDKLYRKIWI